MKFDSQMQIRIRLGIAEPIKAYLKTKKSPNITKKFEIFL